MANHSSFMLEECESDLCLSPHNKILDGDAEISLACAEALFRDKNP